jgi:hypothetical protein
MKNENGVIVMWNEELYSLLNVRKKAHRQPLPKGPEGEGHYQGLHECLILLFSRK